MQVLGVEATVRSRQFELALDRIFGLADSHPDVIATALSHTRPFVPERGSTIGGGAQGAASLTDPPPSSALPRRGSQRTTRPTRSGVRQRREHP